ncbi:RloB family protein [Chloroflexus sp. MS-G]|jgi:hypothetical protein|uniref:RloB family protein n=1 Tax=Chloroflexus sp. MS-G TaxID=1521187 RepID=UPI0004DEE150|nr:RloB family protein [Chloroflexus sp. MS-G]
MAKHEGRIKRHQGRRGRIVGRREVRQRFLIVCEGEQTEPNYFRAFQVPGVVIDIRSTNNRGLDIINKAIQLRTEDEYDQVWCVFDRDDLPNAIIHQAFNQARRANINIAFSNQAFELWYLLHFGYYNTAMTRNGYRTRLCSYLKPLGYTYTKNSTNMYTVLLDRQATAIDHARRLYNQYNPWDPATADPSTTVHLLVETLNKHRRP